MKKHLPDLVAVLAFVILSFVYFFPAVIEDRILFQHDTAAGAGAGQEAKEYYEKTGERTRWTNSIFGGMPTYQISPSYNSTDSLRMVEKVYHLFLPNYVWLMFVMLLGFYILLRVFGVGVLPAVVGAVAWGLSSYFFILMANGHIWKFVTLAYIPPTIAGIVLAYKGRYLAGGLLAAVFAALQILSNHVQMTYYFLFVILALVIAYFIELKQQNLLSRFWKATGALLAAAVVAVAINASNLYHTYSYSKETMRGKSELTHVGEKANQTSSGLDRDYITQWSYGIGETFSLLVPNVKGGVSDPLAYNATAMKKAKPMYESLYTQLTQYFGEQPMTRGPVYVGALVLMLFFVGCFVVKGPVKWALVAVTVLTIMLSWGHNYMWLTNLFIDYVPMYNKFRAVSSILVVAEFTIPLLAVLALKELVAQPGHILGKWRNALLISFALTGGLALLFALFPRVFFSSYVPAMEMHALRNALDPQHLPGIVANLEEMRVAMFTADAWRSFLIILAGAALLLLWGKKKLNATVALAGMAVICLVDLWQVDKRYLHNDLFEPRSVQTNAFRKTPIDEYILKDAHPDPDYRVLNMATNTFNENNTAYHHKSVGGYHAAKMRRYQELIEHYIAPQMQAARTAIAQAKGDMQQVSPDAFPVLNMLNTKYIIIPVGQGEALPLPNPHAQGNAWFVQNVRYADNANAEMAALAEEDLTQTAIVNKEFAPALANATTAQVDSTATLTLQTYEPNRLVFNTDNPQEGIAVFSEIYYPQWEVTIDGTPATLARANYVLRALKVPAGKHVIEMTFKPQSIAVTESIAYGALLVLLAGVGLLVWQERKGRGR